MNVQRERELTEAVRQAVGHADLTIMRASDGSVEETDWLTAHVAVAFVQKLELAATAKVMQRDLTHAAVVADLALKVADVLREAVGTDGAHHKQWYLEQVAEAMGVTLPDHEEGIAP